MTSSNDSGINSQFIQDTMDTISNLSMNIKATSDEYAKTLETHMDKYRALAKSLMEGSISTEKFAKEIIKVQKEINEFDLNLKRSGTKTTHLYNKMAEELTATIYKLQMLGKKIDEDVLQRINIASSNVYSKALMQSRGSDNPVFKNTDNDQLKDINKELDRVLSRNMTGLQRWWVSWANGYTVENDKKNKGLVNALIDGLAANKFVGGAAKDTVRLLGLLAGSWIKSHVKGPLGSILAGGAYIISEIAATVVPLVIGMMARGAIQGLMQGWVMGAMGKGAAGGAAQLGATALLGTGATGTAATILGASSTVEGIIDNKNTIHGADEIAKLAKERSGPIVGQNEIMYGFDHKAATATEDLTKAMNKNTSWVSKILQPLSKMWAPISKIGGNLLRVGGNLLGGIGSIFTGVSAYNSAKEGDAVGAWLKGISSVTGIAGAVTGLTGIGAVATPFLWGASIVTGILGSIWDMVKGGDKKKFTSDELSKVEGTFPVGPTGRRQRGTGGGTSLQVSGGRKHVGSDLVNALDPRSHAGKDLKQFIKNSEGFRPYAYDDVTGKRLYKGDVPVGTPTIAWGRAHGVKPGDTVTKAQAEKFLNDDIYSAKGRIATNLKKYGIPGLMPQAVYDLLIDSEYQQAGYTWTPAVISALKRQDWDGFQEALYATKNSSSRRKNDRRGYYTSHKMKNIPKGETIDIAPEASNLATSSTAGVAAPETPKEEETKKETKNEVSKAIKDGFSEALKEVNTLKEEIESKTNPTAKQTLPDSSLESIFKATGGLDIPGNDSTLSVLTKLNRISLFGGQ